MKPNTKDFFHLKREFSSQLSLSLHLANKNIKVVVLRLPDKKDSLQFFRANNLSSLLAYIKILMSTTVQRPQHSSKRIHHHFCSNVITSRTLKEIFPQSSGDMYLEHKSVTFSIMSPVVNISDFGDQSDTITQNNHG